MILGAFTLLAAPWLREAPASQLVLATSTGIEDNPLLFVLNFGVLGVWVFCNATGLQPTRGEMRRVEGRVEDLRADLAKEREDHAREIHKERTEKDALRDQLMRTLPTFAQAANTMAQQVVPVVQQADQTQAQLAQTFAHLLDRAEELLGDDHPHPDDAG